MKKYLVDKKDEIREIEVRDRLVSFSVTRDFVVSVIGPRRAGKTYSLFNFIKKLGLKDEDFLFVNFEDEVVKALGRSEVVKMLSYHYELYGKYPDFVFLDELQGFDGWQSFVYSLYERKKYHIFVTGSSSKLLSKEIASQLRGRGISVLVLPFSFKEFAMLKGVSERVISTRQEDKVKKLLRVYLEKGGFPNVLLSDVNKRVFFRDYVDLVVFRDVVERFGIRNAYLVKMLMSSMASSFSKEFSVSKVYNSFKSMGVGASKSTLYDYAYALEEAMFCFFLKKFSFSERTSELSTPKVYLNDVGLINYFLSTRVSENLGRLMENLVFLELKRRENKGILDYLFYWQDVQGREVDFVIKKGLRVSQLVQVTNASAKDEVEERELKGLLKASEELNCDDLLVLTWDYENTEEIKGKKVKFTPLWKWLLE